MAGQNSRFNAPSTNQLQQQAAAAASLAASNFSIQQPSRPSAVHASDAERGALPAQQGRARPMPSQQVPQLVSEALA